MKTDYKIIQQTEQNQYWNISKANDVLRLKKSGSYITASINYHR